MGTLFASQAFIERYLKMGMQYNIPVMFPGGHNTLIAGQDHCVRDQYKPGQGSRQNVMECRSAGY
jgi:hypothetical protein